MTHGDDINYVLSIEDVIDDPSIADADAPEIRSAFKLCNTCRSRLVCQCIYLSQDAQCDRRIKRLEFFPRGASEGNRVLRHRAYGA